MAFGARVSSRVHGQGPLILIEFVVLGPEIRVSVPTRNAQMRRYNLYLRLLNRFVQRLEISSIAGGGSILLGQVLGQSTHMGHAQSILHIAILLSPFIPRRRSPSAILLYPTTHQPLLSRTGGRRRRRRSHERLSHVSSCLDRIHDRRSDRAAIDSERHRGVFRRAMARSEMLGPSNLM